MSVADLMEVAISLTTVRSPLLGTPLLRQAMIFPLSGPASPRVEFRDDVGQTQVPIDHQHQEVVEKIADFGGQLLSTLCPTDILRRNDRLRGLFADLLEDLVKALFEEVGRV